MEVIPLTLITCLSILPAYAKYSGGNGMAHDPYQIAMAADLIALGETPDDYDKRFILTADIDLDPNLPGRKIFDKAVIAPDTDDLEDDFQGASFTGVFNGNGHTISHLTIGGESYLGLFGLLYGEVRNLSIANSIVVGSGSTIGGLAGRSEGDILASYGSGTITGHEKVGGLVGDNGGNIAASYSTGMVTGEGWVAGDANSTIGGLVGYNHGDIILSHSIGTVTGYSAIGGLVGSNARNGSIATSYAASAVSGEWDVGGLVGGNKGTVTTSYSSGWAIGDGNVGGLVGVNEGTVTASYSTGAAIGPSRVGGLVGENDSGSIVGSYSTSRVTAWSFGWDVGGLVGENSGDVATSFWDQQTSGQATSAGGTPKTTAEMQTARTFLVAGWDFVNETPNGTSDYWQISPGDYPRLWYVSLPSYVRYSSGSGTVDSPYHIATAADLILLGESPQDYDKHFILTADIDLDPNLPGRKVFDRAVIAPDISQDRTHHPFEGFAFTGVFDGNDCVISNLSIQGNDYLGLFGLLGSGGRISNLGVEAVEIRGAGGGYGYCVGSLMGWNGGSIATSYSTGTVTASGRVGGLVGENFDGSIADSYSTCAVTSGGGFIGGLVGSNGHGSITASYSAGTVTGTLYTKDSMVIGGGGLVGGLAGSNEHGSITRCHSTSSVSGNETVGGLVGENFSPPASVVNCYSTGAVSGRRLVGGLVARNEGSITTSWSTGAVTGGALYTGGLVGINGGLGDIANCYSTGAVSGDNRYIGGLVGDNFGGRIATSYSAGAVSGVRDVGGLVGRCTWGSITASFWDVGTSGQATSAGGTDQTTPAMQDINTYLDVGWDFVEETENGTEDIWWIVDGRDYPRLLWEPDKYGGGTGKPCDPYLIYSAEHLNAIGAEPDDWDKHFKLMADIELSGYSYDRAVIAPDTEDATRGFYGTSFTGTFNGAGHTISHLTIAGMSYLGLFGRLGSGAMVSNLSLEAAEVKGTHYCIGALAGLNAGSIIIGCSNGMVEGGISVGGLVGANEGNIGESCSTGVVTGFGNVGGLVGYSSSSITESYSAAEVSGDDDVGGLVGWNSGDISSSYSAGAVSGDDRAGGLVGYNREDANVRSSFWDIDTSGLSSSDAGDGRTTADMQVINTFLEADWDFIDETDNGTEDIWWILEGQGYPKLWWELISQD